MRCVGSRLWEVGSGWRIFVYSFPLPNSPSLQVQPRHRYTLRKDNNMWKVRELADKVWVLNADDNLPRSVPSADGLPLLLVIIEY